MARAAAPAPMFSVLAEPVAIGLPVDAVPLTVEDAPPMAVVILPAAGSELDAVALDAIELDATELDSMVAEALEDEPEPVASAKAETPEAKALEMGAARLAAIP